MPYSPKSVKRPWITQVDYNTPGQGRRIISTFYKSTYWTKLSAAFKKGISYHLGKEPHMNAICIECKKHGIITPTTVTDHIKPINPVNAYDTQRGRYGEPLEWTNLQPLCIMHHNQKSGRERQTNK